MTSDQANEIYNSLNQQTFWQMQFILAQKALTIKFKDINLKYLLLLTGDSELLWDDPSNIWLGAGTKENPGKNKVGEILTQLRLNFSQENINFPQVQDKKEIFNFMTKDPFMESWIKMRVMDMCSNVYKCKKYLSNNGQEQQIDARFVKTVLDIILLPCAPIIEMGNRIKIQVPEFFTNLVYSCKGIPTVSKNYQDELKSIQEDIQKADEMYLGINRPQKDWKIMDFLKKQIYNYKKFLESNPSEDEKNDFFESQKILASSIIPGNLFPFSLAQDPSKIYQHISTNTIESKQRDEWEKLLEDINRPKYSSEQIKQKLQDLQNFTIDTNTYIKSLKEEEIKELKSSSKDPKLLKKDIKLIEDKYKNYTLSPFDKIQINKLQTEQKDKQIKEIYRSQLSKKEKNKRMNELRNKQSKDLQIHYGINITKSKEEKIQHKKYIQELQEKLYEINRKRKEELTYIEFSIQEISKIYWNTMVSMIVFLIDHTKQTNEQDIRQIIASIEMLNSEKTSCISVPNLNNQTDNCIASALSNLLIGIKKFKYQYAEQIPFSKSDIDLATSIIIDQDISDDIDKPIESVDEFQENIPDENESINSDNENQDYEVEDEIDLEDNDEPNDEMNAEFGVKKLTKLPKFKSDIEQINMILLNINQNQPISNLNLLSNYFMEMINKIKTFKMSKMIKQNRINFFATLR
jgi:hypothetical protein